MACHPQEEIEGSTRVFHEQGPLGQPMPGHRVRLAELPHEPVEYPGHGPGCNAVRFPAQCKHHGLEHIRGMTDDVPDRLGREVRWQRNGMVMVGLFLDLAQADFQQAQHRVLQALRLDADRTGLADGLPQLINQVP